MEAIVNTENQTLKDISTGKYRNCFLVYARKSTDEPDNQKNSIKYQRAENTKFAYREKLPIAPVTLNGLCVDGVIAERHSGFKEDNKISITSAGMVQYRIERPKFQRLIQFLSKGLFKGVIVLCWDRISRNRGDDTAVRKLMKNGIDVRFVYANYEKTSAGALHMDIDGMFAEHHSRVTSEKVKITTRNLRDRGICTYKAPIGYLNQGTMEHKPLDPVRAPIIKRMFEILTAQEWSLSDLTKWANEQGLNSICRVVLKNGQWLTNFVKMDASVRGMTVMAKDKLGIMTDSNFLTLDLQNGKQEDITPGKNALTSLWASNYKPYWLYYSSETGQFLFCSWDQSDWRHLYCLRHGSNGWEFVQKNFGNEHSYNGRWIQKGLGFAFVGNINNHYYVAVRPSNNGEQTNLFLGGKVCSYLVSPDEDKIYATASVKSEPPGVWEYSISSRTLRKVETDSSRFSAAAIIPRQEHSVISADNLKIHYFVVPPRDVANNRKYPVILYLPVPDNQADASWDMYSQFFGNIGVYHVAVDYRGVDGYGKEFSDSCGPGSVRDIDAVYREIIKNPTVDRKRIFLMGFCGATALANQTIEQFPRHWAGVISIRGAPPSQKAIVQQRMKAFYYIPSDHKMVSDEQIAEWKNWAATNHEASIVNIRTKDITHAPVMNNTKIDRATLVKLADFVFEN